MLGLRERATQNQRPEGVGLPTDRDWQGGIKETECEPTHRNSKICPIWQEETMKLREARRRRFYSARDLAEKADVSAAPHCLRTKCCGWRRGCGSATEARLR